MEYTSDGLFLIDLIKHRIEENNALFGKVNLDTRDQLSRNALYWAIVYGHYDAVKLFVSHGISLEVAPQLSAFELAQEMGDNKIIALLGEESLPLSA